MADKIILREKPSLPSTLRVLIAEDSQDDAFFIVKALEETGCEILHKRVFTPESMEEALSGETWDVVIADYAMPRFTGLQALALFRAHKLDIPFLVVSGAIGEDTAVEAMKSGAHDYIMKGNLARLVPAVKRELQQAKMRAGRRRAVNTIRKMNEELLKANEDLKALDEMKTQLLSNVSHELRTPLVAIKGYSELLSSGESGPLNALQQQQLAVSLRNIDKLMSLINNLLDFSRMQFGKEKWSVEKFDLKELLNASLESFRALMKSKGQSIATVFPEGPVPMESDRDKITRVFSNLLDNAVKFTPAKGKITLSLALAPGGRVEIGVSDNGPGIPKSALKKIFDRFYQVDPSSTRRHGGVGLGLSLCREIVDRLGGEISVKSSESKGTAFTVTLPLVSPAEAALQQNAV